MTRNEILAAIRKLVCDLDDGGVGWAAAEILLATDDYELAATVFAQQVIRAQDTTLLQILESALVNAEDEWDDDADDRVADWSFDLD